MYPASFTSPALMADIGDKITILSIGYDLGEGIFPGLSGIVDGVTYLLDDEYVLLVSWENGSESGLLCPPDTYIIRPK
jgi:hypothetical protein